VYLQRGTGPVSQGEMQCARIIDGQEPRRHRRSPEVGLIQISQQKQTDIVSRH